MGRIKIPDVIGFDFETAGIQRRPDYPPQPKSVSIQYPGQRKATFYAWGHPTGNNCTQAEGYNEVRKAFSAGIPLVFQNGKFDIDVAEVHCDVKRLDWTMYHDTMFLIFLYDPHAMSYGLKPASERILGMPPEEQDRVKEWVLAHKREIEAKHGPFTPKEWGAHICEAPGTLVKPYANGDVERTIKMFKHLWPIIQDGGQGPAYDTERELMPILLDNERTGMRVDRKRLEQDIPQYQTCLARSEAWLRKRLNAPDLNIDSDTDIAKALKTSGVVTQFVQTPTGKNSTSKKNMTVDLFSDKKVFHVLGYRNRLTTCLRMFMERWYGISAKSGYINTNWNQVRQSSRGGGGDSSGTRTGRPSTTDPNFLNLSKAWYDKGDGYAHPKGMSTLLELPLVRNYILPDPGGVFLHRDYNQQELRLLAHFENDLLMTAYQDNPAMDIHEFVAQMVKEVLGLTIQRRQAKVVNFGLLYGMGAEKLAGDMDTDVATAKRIKAAQLQSLPGLKGLKDDIERIAKANEPIHTFNGRAYMQEPPMLFKGRMINFRYKLLNYLIQGSAADVTKRAIIRHHVLKRDSRFMVTVYDEINISAPRGKAKQEMALLREAMEGIEGIDVAMLTDGKHGPNWGALQKFNDPKRSR